MNQFEIEKSDSSEITLEPVAVSRRRFMELTFWGITGVTTLGLLGGATRFLAGNALEPKTTDWVEIGNISDLMPGSIHQVNYSLKAKDAWRTIDQKGSVYAYTEDGTDYVVLSATCTHLGCNVHWENDINQFYCPCHSGYFARNGDVISGPPPRPLARLPTKIEEGVLYAQI